MTKNNPIFKTCWTNSSPINYDRVIVTKNIKGRPLGIVDIDGQNTIITKKNNYLYFLNNTTFKESLKPLKIFNKKHIFLYDQRIVNINNNIYLLARARTPVAKANTPYGDDLHYLIWVNISKREVSQYKYEKIKDLTIANIDGVTYALIIAVGVGFEKWDIEKNEIVGLLDYPECEGFSIDLFGEIAKIRASNYGFIDCRNMKIINVIDGYNLDGYKSHTSTSLKWNGKWVTITCAGRYDEPLRRNFIWDMVTGKIIAELPGDGDPQNTAGYNVKTTYNSKGDPLLIMTDYLSSTKSIMYNLNHIDDGFKYFRYLDNETKEYKYLQNDITLVKRGNEKLIVENETGRIWSLETLQPIKEATPPPAEKISGELFPITLPNNVVAFLDWRRFIWNPFGKDREYNEVTHLLASSLNGKGVFLSASIDRYLRLFDTATGKMICQSVQLKNDIRNITIANLKGKNVVVVSLRNDIIEIYDLQTFSRYDTTITIDGGEFEMCIAEFEGKTQLIANVGDGHIDTWDLETGTPIHKSLEIEREDGDTFEDLDITIHLIYLNGNPVLVIVLFMLNEVLLYDLVKGHNLGELEFDEMMMNYACEYTGDYFTEKIRTILVNNKTILVTSSPGAIACFDPENDFDRVGKMLITGLEKFETSGEIEIVGLEVLNVNGKNIVIAYGREALEIYDMDNYLDNYTKLKKIEFNQRISALTVSDNKIIVACGEEITAIEVK